MRGNNVVGVLFSNVHDDKIRELTERRTIASVPFGGRYRLIDFPLSNMVNSGISKVGVVTKSNFQSLMDHLGSGKHGIYLVNATVFSFVLLLESKTRIYPTAVLKRWNPFVIFW